MLHDPLIVAVNAGSAVITAKCGTQTASCLVTCDFKVVDEEQPSGDEELSLNNTDMTFFSPGEQFTLAVKQANGLASRRNATTCP